MAVVRCTRGHYFDNEKFSTCPHCTSHKTEWPESFSQRQTDSYAAEYIRKNRAGAEKEERAYTEKTDIERANIEKTNTEKTTGIYQNRESTRYAAGWLVCIKGEEYGCNYPLYAGFNRIGRSYGCDITLTDPMVSAKEHCSVIYEEKKNLFFVLPKDGNFVYVEEETVEGAQEIKSGQVITLGETQLELAVFCTGEKRWIKK